MLFWDYHAVCLSGCQKDPWELLFNREKKSLWLVCSSGSYRQDSGEAVLYFLFKINPAECFLKTTLSAGCGITVEKKNDFVSLLLSQLHCAGYCLPSGWIFTILIMRVCKPGWFHFHLECFLFSSWNLSYFLLVLPLSISELAVFVWGCPVLFCVH